MTTHKMFKFVGLILFLTSLRNVHGQGAKKIDRFVGESCKTADLVDGACTVLIECQPIFDKLKIDKNYDNLVHCNFIGSSPVICCPGKSPTSTVPRQTTKSPSQFIFELDYDDYDTTTPKVPATTTATVRIPYVMATRVILNKAEIACANWQNISSPPIFNNILHGVSAQAGEFPHMAGLGIRSDEAGIDYQFVCGGTLISEKFVLTAAHCRERIVRGSVVPVSIVRLGKVTINTEEDSLTAVDVGVSEFIRHDLYNSSLQYHDIALIRLNQTISFSDVILPACLYVDRNYIGSETLLYATGWGQTGFGSTSDILLKINLTSLPFEECNNIIGGLSPIYVRKLPNGIIDSQICVQDRDKDVCTGDSGGPLQILGTTQVSTVVGVVSVGLICAPTVRSIPGVYTSVAYYLQWIENYVWP